MKILSYHLLGVLTAVSLLTASPAHADKAVPPAGKEVTAAPRQFASLVYPALGNISLDEGTLEMWVVSDFDVADKDARCVPLDIRYLDDPVQHLIMAYMNRHFAFIGFTRPKRQNYVWSETLTWKPKEAHHIALTWKGRIRSFYIDGRVPPPNSIFNDALQGPGRPDTSENIVVEDWIHGDLSKTQLCFGAGYSALTFDEIRISSIARPVEEIRRQMGAAPTADVYTLLLDHCDGGPAEVISGLSGEKGGALSGAFRIVDTQHGKGIALWSDLTK